jgi:hypothetical protein
MKHVIKYKLFENKDIYNDFLTQDEVVDFFNNHLNNDRLKKFMTEYNYPFLPITPIIKYNHDEDNDKYIIIYKFIKDNSESEIIYTIDYKLYCSINYTVSIKVSHVNDDDYYILIDYHKKGSLYTTNSLSQPKIGKEKLLDAMYLNKSDLKFIKPQIKINSDGSRDFLNLKTFMIDLKLIPILNKYKSNKSALDTKITTNDFDYYKLISNLDITDFQIQKRNDDWIYFNYRDTYEFLSKINVSNQYQNELNIQYMIHEQYLPKIVRLYKEIKKEVNDEFNN